MQITLEILIIIIQILPWCINNVIENAIVDDNFNIGVVQQTFN